MRSLRACPAPLGAEYRATLARFESIRDKVDVEDYIVHRLRDGATVWDSMTNPGQRTVLCLAGPEEAARLMVPARGQIPSSIGDQAIMDDATSGLPLVRAERATASKRRATAPLDVGAGSSEHTAAAPAPKPHGKAKAPAKAGGDHHPRRPSIARMPRSTRAISAA